MRRNKELNFSLHLLLIFFSLIFISGCSSSSDSEEEEYEAEIKSEVHNKSEAEIQAERILEIAKEEQKNEMYSPDVDCSIIESKS